MGKKTRKHSFLEKHRILIAVLSSLSSIAILAAILFFLSLFILPDVPRTTKFIFSLLGATILSAGGFFSGFFDTYSFFLSIIDERISRTSENENEQLTEGEAPLIEQHNETDSRQSPFQIRDYLPPLYSGRVQNFFVEYLGTSENPVPFGGRQSELSVLDVWLTSPDTPAYALIVAEAGRGKSALLTQWARSATTRRIANVIFIPISIRFGTATENVAFTLLATKLGEIYGEQIDYHKLTVIELREICFKFLDRTPPNERPLVVILDGLDEAMDWEVGPDLFPLSPPPNIHILASARVMANLDESGWLEKLGWNQPDLGRIISLPPLSKAGIVDVLEAMEHPLDQLSTKIDIVDELFRLSQGDPLLVRLYVEALLPPDRDSPAIIAPEDLPGIEAGLNGYFEKWWYEQERIWGEDAPTQRVEVQVILSMLACAIGPLNRDDLLELAPDNSNLNAWTLDNAIKPLSRFISGDGRSRGYVFNHPRLNNYFYYQKLTAEDRTTWETLFLEYGRQTLDKLSQGKISQGEVSHYVIENYGTHLIQANASLDDIAALITPTWFELWERLTGTFSGFLNYVSNALLSANESYNPDTHPVEQQTIGLQCRFSLVISSLHTLAAELPPKLVRELIEVGQWTTTQGLDHIRLSPSPKNRVESIVEILPLLESDLKSHAIDLALDDVREN